MAPAILSQARRAAEAALEAVTTPQATTTPTLPEDNNPQNGLGESAPSSDSNNSNTLTSNTTTIVLIVVIVLCGTAIMCAAIFYLFDRKKNHQFREACKRDPYLTRKEFARRRKLSALERLEEEELQRSVMIRKSLASRNTHSRTPSRESSSDDGEFHDMAQRRRMSVPPSYGGYEQLHQQYQHGRSCSSQTLQPGWAPGEARRVRSDSESTLSGSPPRGESPYAEPHPGVEVEIPLHSQSRTPSPTRMPLIGRKPVPPAMPAVPHGVEYSRRHSSFIRT
ncbi:transcription factor TF2b [Colletotrichum sojae]|uniref:Transcription factor TF2b n=1 Tax=Colletotrichum sojae TaxID=2175907 RepID=A0A8H6JLZ2_9PEZI|nr:transcription factor TF2b [Colletotrichum sojae]